MLHSAIFWFAVSMAIFFAVVWKPGRRAVTGALDNQREVVRAELERARALRTEAEALLTRSREQQANALKEAETIIAEARQDADRLRNEASDRLKTLLAARESEALAKLAEAEAAAEREARQVAARIALAASRDLLRQRLTAEPADRLVDKAIAELA